MKKKYRIYIYILYTRTYRKLKKKAGETHVVLKARVIVALGKGVNGGGRRPSGILVKFYFLILVLVTQMC